MTTELRWIWIDGPPLLRSVPTATDPLKIERGLPLWSLRVGAGYFDRDNAADYAHPLRTLMIDARTTTVSVEGKSPFFQTKKPQHPLRAPRLIDVHLIAGAGKFPYRPHTEDETLQVNFHPESSQIGAVVVNKNADKPAFSTIGGKHEGEDTDAQEGFVHVIGEPQLVAGKQEGDFIDQAGHTSKASENAIRVPRLRLLQGAIRLKIDVALPWLGNLDPLKALPSDPKSFELVLTPSGIEIITGADFPGSPKKLRGVFLIAPRNLRDACRDQMTGEDKKSKFKPSALTLTLLPPETSKLAPVGGSTVPPVEEWMTAWRHAAAPTLPVEDELRCGIDIRALPSDLPPRFSWPIYLRKEPSPPVALVAATLAGADPPLAVDTPTNRLRIELRGSKGPDGTHEGAAALMMTRLRIATRSAAKVLAEELHRQNYLDEPAVPDAASGTVIVAEARPDRGLDQAPAQTAAPRYWTVSKITATDSVEMALRIKGSGSDAAAATIPLAYDEHRLAAALRTAVGWDEPRRQKAVNSKAPGRESFTQAHQPIISGFVPLDRGWLQLPLPNLPPLDLEKDTSLLGALNPTPPTVLDGFIRIAQRPAPSFVSGYQSKWGTPVGETAPWSITVEGAGVAVVMAAVEADKLVETRAVLREPDLAARGLLWFSADRPDALEALPRLGAGPGSFLDLDLTTTPAPDPAIRVVTASLGVLNLTFDKNGGVARHKLNIALAFNPAAVDWHKGLAGTDAGRHALEQARQVLLGAATTLPAPVDLEPLRKTLAEAESRLALAEADLAKAERRRVALAAEIAEASSRHAAFEARRKTLLSRRAKAQAAFDMARIDREPEQFSEASANLFAIERELDEFETNFSGNAGRLTALKAEKAKLDGDANVRDEIVRVARAQAEKARIALAEAEGSAGAFKNPVPWPPVAWLRHPDLPIAAGMPMTRAAASAVRPLESREFAPFVASTAITGRAIKLAALTWEGAQAFPDLDALPAFEQLAKGWPRPEALRSDPDVLGPTIGVPFTAFGVPGTEIVPVAKPAKEWKALEFAVRYDLPALDEAFATAGLPPVRGPAPQEDEREKASDRATATALDWPLLKDFWDDQERRRHLSLVLDSYLDDFRPADGSQSLQVRTLIRGATWTVSAAFNAAHLEKGLPYGAMTFGIPDPPGAPPQEAFTANTALKGLSGKISFKSDKVIEVNAAAPTSPVFDMLGWSPSSFDRGEFRVDNQGFGIADPVRHSSGVITRRYRRELGVDAKIFASTEQAIIMQGPVPFSFWFKDIPLSAAGTFDRRGADTAVNFKAWLDPEEGFEWRLYRRDAPRTFDEGRDRFAFFGLALEPLRLLNLELQLGSSGQATSNVPRRLEILARVFFADDIEQPITGGNLIVMAFTTDGSDLHLDSIQPVGTAGKLLFAFEANDASLANSGTGAQRHMLLTATPAWTSDQLTLNDASVSLSLHGRSVTLKNPMIACQDQPPGGSVTLTWNAAGADAPIKSGQARLRITKLSIESSLDSAARFDQVSLFLDRAVEICTAQGQEGAPEFVAQFNGRSGASAFRVLNSEFGLKGEGVREDDHAIVLTWANSNVITPIALLPGLETGADAGVALMLAARVDAPAPSSPWILPLGCGRCEGEIRSSQDSANRLLHTRWIRWDVDGRRPERPDAQVSEIIWDGIIAISGTLTGQSAIKWPRLITSPGGSPGRRRVTRSNDNKTFVHHATYIFDDHRLPLDACRRVGGAWTFGRPWTAFAAVHHQLWEDEGDALPGSGKKGDLEWTGLESIAIGRALDLIPKLPPDKTIESVTFAPRYRYAFAGAPDQTAEMMIQPGLGAMQTVLQGTSGAAFRKAFWSGAGDGGIVAAAGFLGLQASDRDNRNAEEPLLRLPFLAGLHGSQVDALGPGTFSQSEFPAAGIELAWVDTAAARTLLVRDRHAIAPASAREADLTASIRAGALIEHDDAAPPKGEIVAALAAEQTFRANPPAEIAPSDWKDVPYWIGSAVTVSRALEHYARADGPKPAREFRPLSLLAGSVSRGKRASGTAALLQGIPAKLLKQEPRSMPSALISGGATLVVEDWSGGDAATAENSGINGYAAGLAAAQHARPLFAVVRTRDAAGVTHYTPITLPRAVIADLPRIRQGSREQTRFAEGARGYPIDPGVDSRRWLSPVLEGPLAAVRDDGVDGKSSGLAGLGRSLKFPAQAGEEVRELHLDAGRAKLARSLIWLTEKRIPVYVPLDVKGMESPPISWLQGASPRVRLPSDADVAMVLQNSGLGDTGRPSKRLAAQSFLPAAADALTVSERAGIVTARRTFLMGAVPETDAFDPEQTRFGRAGQAGSSARRWMRTPRPARLPDNTGDAERDRRPEASPLLPQAPLRFLVGPADTLRGETSKAETVGALVPWSATMVAAPFSDGVVSDRWDGTVRLTVELDVAAPPTAPGGTAQPPGEAGKLLTQLLFPHAANDRQAVALGSMKVGDTLFQLRWITVLESQTWVARNPKGEPATAGERIVWRARVDLILDPREQQPAIGAEPAGIHVGLAAALSAGFYTVELRLTVHPSQGNAKAVAVGAPVALAITDQPALAVGTDRPPVTLRWTLPAVTAMRGGMPLLPTTLLFVDPAYEAGLANPPHEKAVLLDTKDVKDLPANRGAVRVVFSADRGRVNRRGSVAFMVDARFERPPEALANTIDGDLAPQAGTLILLAKLIPSAATDSIRFLLVAGKADPPVGFGLVYELSLATLTEADGSPARLRAGDVLELIVSEREYGEVKLKMHNSETGKLSDEIPLSKPPGSNVPKPAGDQSSRGFGLALPLTLTDEPVVEPPPALYAALALTSRKTGPALSLPLYAQSPLPWRVDFRDLKRDFRAGLVRRSATFVWSLSRSLTEIGTATTPASMRAHVVKMDRNGQTYLPETTQELLLPERIGTTH